MKHQPHIIQELEQALRDKEETINSTINYIKKDEVKQEIIGLVRAYHNELLDTHRVDNLDDAMKWVEGLN